MTNFELDSRYVLNYYSREIYLQEYSVVGPFDDCNIEDLYITYFQHIWQTSHK